MVITEQEFNDWKQHLVTKAFMKALFKDREFLKEMLLAGTEDDSEVRGRAAAIRNIVQMTYEDLMTSLAEKGDTINE